jgi:hypothetical protein
MSRLSRATFTKLLIGKSICEGLLVTTVAAGLFLVTTNTGLRGGLDHADAQTISGWAIDDSNPGSRVEVQLFIDDNFTEQRTANELRSDVQPKNGTPDDWDGFVFKTPQLAAGEHEIKVYILHRGVSLSRRTLQIIGNPIRFKSDGLP